jgi:ATP synthase protein I
VVLVQAEAGAVVALLAGLVLGFPALWSALYGAATAVVPSALMARAVARMANSRSPVATALSLLGWESAKIICAVAMLAAAKQVLQTVVWPVLLVALAVCLAVYWVALAWRRPR